MCHSLTTGIEPEAGLEPATLRLLIADYRRFSGHFCVLKSHTLYRLLGDVSDAFN
jgi:hypothetical protein